jgi:hypothetical protein
MPAQGMRMKARRAYASRSLVALLGVSVACVLSALLMLRGEGVERPVAPAVLAERPTAAVEATADPIEGFSAEAPSSAVKSVLGLAAADEPVAAAPIDDDPTIAREVKVVVIDSSGAPAAAATVDIWPIKPPELRHVEPAASLTTDAKGRARATLPGRELLFVAEDEGGSASRVQRSALGDARLLAPGDRAFVVELRPKAHVRGRVLDVAGRPETGAVVTLSPRSEHGENRIVRSATAPALDAQGRFEADVDGGGRYRVRADLGAERTLAVNVSTEPGGTYDVTLQFAGDWWVQGLVVDDAGQPVPGARLSVWQDPAEGTPQHVAGESDEVGRFRIAVKRLAPGMLVAWTEPPHPQPYWRSRAVNLSAEDAAAHHDVTVRLLPPAPISGHVRDAEGRPLKGQVALRLVDRADTEAEQRILQTVGPIGNHVGRTDASGAFSIACVPAEFAYDLSFLSDWGAPGSFGRLPGVKAGTEDVTLIARPTNGAGRASQPRSR